MRTSILQKSSAGWAVALSGSGCTGDCPRVVVYPSRQLNTTQCLLAPPHSGRGRESEKSKIWVETETAEYDRKGRENHNNDKRTYKTSVAQCNFSPPADQCPVRLRIVGITPQMIPLSFMFSMMPYVMQYPFG